MKHTLGKITISVGFILSLLLFIWAIWPVSTALAAPPFPSPDVDGDGISNDLETTGWYNLSGGPYVTDPLNPDSDNDGLTDGEEKLYGTNPLDNTSPGIYVRYENSFETKQYFSASNEMEDDEWGNSIRKYLPVLQGGDKYLMTEAMVARRGTTFHIGGPIGSTLSLQRGPGLTLVTPVTDTCQSSWSVTMPLDGTTGTYTATVTLGAWSKSLPIYVIFDFPSDLTPAEIDAYIYDDDPANLRDEVSVWWRTPEWSYYSIPPNWPYGGTITHSWYMEEGVAPNPPVDCSGYPNNSCSNWQFHHTYGYAQAFWTEQFTQKVFVKHVMPVIQGKTSQDAAVYTGPNDNNLANVNDLIDEADKEFRTVYQNTHNNWSDAMHKVITGTNWTMNGGACQDNANVFVTLLRSAGIAAKPFLQDYNKTAGHGEGGQIGSIYEYDHAVLLWLNHHWKAARSYNGDESWDAIYPFYNGRTPTRELYGFYGDYAADQIISSDYRWDWQQGSNGGGMVNTVWNGAGEGIPTAEFGYPNNNWDIDWNSRRPLEIKRSPYAVILNYESWYGDGWAPSEWSNPPEKSSPPYNSNPAGRVATQTYATLDIPVPNLPDPAHPLENWPRNPKVTDCSPSSVGTADCTAIVGLGGLDVPEVTGGPTTFIDPLKPPKKDARFTGVFSHQALDTDGDGAYEILVIHAPLEVIIPGSFRAEGDLYDAQGGFIGHAEWNGSEPLAALQFNITKTSPPYTLAQLRLYKIANNDILDSRHYKAYQINDLANIDQGAINFGSLPGAPAGGISTLAVTTTNVFTVSVADTDGSGKADKLFATVGVTTDFADSYRVEGLLVDETGTPVVWSVSDPQPLAVGSGELTLTFDGRVINDYLRFTPTAAHTFTLVGVKIFRTNLTTSTLEAAVNTATTTPAYTGDQFDPPSPFAGTIFKDNIPNGNNWTSTSPWSLDSNVWASSPYAWRANVSAPQSGNLTTLALNLSNYVKPTLRFKTCYALKSADDLGYLETSPDGGDTWSRVATYTNSTQPWTTKPLDLSAFSDKNANFKFRFNANAQSGLQWAVDDVDLNGWPAVTQVAFTRTPTGTVLVGVSATFTATYSSIAMSLPVTYTWNFGDGDVVTTATSVTHIFATGGDHVVYLTVENPYDSEPISQTIGSGVAVSGVDFISNPAAPEAGVTIAFTATVAPLNATDSITHPLSYTWDFGDGSFGAGRTPTHTYSAGGNYIVKVTADNDLGQAEATHAIAVKEGLAGVSFTYDPALPQEDAIVTFSASYTRPTASQPITYTWNFGDGSTPLLSATPILTHVFANPGLYTVALTGTNGYNAPVTYSQVVTIDGRPINGAAFTYAQIGTSATAAFTATYQPLNATQPVTYTWDFGDGPVVTTNPAIDHTFPGGSDYVVSLTIENAYGSASISQTVSLGVPVTGADFSYSPATPDMNTTVVFTAAVTPLTATNTISHPLIYTWDFGDGGSGTGSTVTHTFNTGGIRTVRVTVSNGLGSAEAAHVLEVKEPLTSVSFIYAPSLPQTDAEVSFLASYTRLSASSPITFTWNFGDGSAPTIQFQSTQPLTHTFANPGVYTVVVTGANGFPPVTYSGVVTINGRALSSAAFTYASTTISATTSFTATYQPLNATMPLTYTWNFGNGVISTTTLPTITYEFSTWGTYTVVLTISNNYGAPVTSTRQLTFNKPQPANKVFLPLIIKNQ